MQSTASLRAHQPAGPQPAIFRSSGRLCVAAPPCSLRNAKRLKYSGMGQRGGGKEPIIVQIEPGAGEEWRVQPIVEMLQKGAVRWRLSAWPAVGCEQSLTSAVSGFACTGWHHPHRHAARHCGRLGKPRSGSATVQSKGDGCKEAALHLVSQFPGHLALHWRVGTAQGLMHCAAKVQPFCSSV